MYAPRLGQTMFVALVLGCAACILPNGAASQTCSGSGLFNMDANPPTLSYGSVSIADLENGQILMGSVNVEILPLSLLNNAWELCIRGEQPQFGPGGKPIEDVEWQLAGAGGWQMASTGEQLVTTGNGLTTVEVLFRIEVGYGDPPGSYEALLAFIAAQP
ncbi:MAG: hypothetical protein ACR2GQ_00540 [Gemmatimonadota bacterium]